MFPQIYGQRQRKNKVKYNEHNKTGITQKTPQNQAQCLFGQSIDLQESLKHLVRGAVK